MLIRQLGLGGSSGGGVDSVIQVLAKSAEPITLIQPATTFTAATPTDGGGGTIVLTSAGAHGLTAAVAVGKSIYISGGTGWPSGVYEVTAVPVDTTGTTFTISGTFDAGMGSPTIALANSVAAVLQIPVPPLQANSAVVANFSFSSTDLTATVKRCRLLLGSTAFFNPSLTTAPNGCAEFTIQNRGVTNSQVGSMPLAASSNAGYGTSNSTHITSSIDTSIPTTLSIELLAASANVPVTLERYVVTLLP